ncbi:uncharacterized protein LOC111319339, partial [Stylophora pistillata]|uniref:uncharacterized protein LOC111319339 n=1 Tax=Stylophora pistillata TaxID=50429 RepID=UPI000C0522E7
MMMIMTSIAILPLSLMVKIWIFNAFSSTANGDSSSVSYSMSKGNFSTVTHSIHWSVNGSVNEYYTADIMNVTSTMSHVMSNSVPVSPPPMLPPHCYHVCKCNYSAEYATSSMKYNMTLNSSSAMYSMASMPSPVHHSMSSESMSVSYHVSPSPSGSSMTYTQSANFTPMSYSWTPWPTPSSTVSEPFYCPDVSCWVEIECMNHTNSISKTSYVSTSSIPPTDCPGKLDCK